MKGRSATRVLRLVAFGVILCFLWLVAATARPVQANCAPLAIPFTSYPRPGEYSYIYAAGWGPSYGGVTFYGLPYDYVPALDPVTLEGVFWALGTGNPLAGVGDDNGTFPADEWLYSRYAGAGYYTGYIVSRNVGWGTDARIDGCITNAPGGCMCVMLTQNQTAPQFLLASARLSSEFMIEFNQPGNAPMVLAEIPRPVIHGVTVETNDDLTFQFEVPAPTGGIYPKDGCDCGLQYQVRQLIAPRGAPPPDNHSASFTDILAGPSDFVGPANGTSACGGSDHDVYLAVQLVASDGVETVLTSDVCGRFECGPTVSVSPEDCCMPSETGPCGSDVGECSAGTRTCDGVPGPELACCEGTWGSCVGQVGPTSDANCDGLDNDCDGTADEDYVADTSCYLPGECAAGNMPSSCVAGSEVACQTGTPTLELCDNLDNDCDGTVDDFATVCGLGPCMSVGFCTAGTDSCVPGTPSAEVPADGIDQDCDGVDDCYEDADGDGYGTTVVITGDDLDCTNTPGESDVATDCDDAQAATYPGAGEVFDGLDNQCPGDYGYGVVDESSEKSGFFNAADRDEYSWPAVPGATQYEYARSNVRDFATGCVMAVTTDLFWSDPFVPSADDVAYYMNRPDGGSWGVGDGGERMPACAP